jgi:hypothetical protein
MEFVVAAVETVKCLDYLKLRIDDLFPVQG